MINEETADRIETFLTNQEGSGPVPRLAPSPDAPSPTEVFEEQYQRIGRWKGPCGTREAQANVAEFWSSQGDAGLRWLAARLRREGHLDALDGTAALLASAGEAAILPILEELERQPPIDQADALLKALRWIGEDGTRARPALIARLEAALSEFLGHRDADVRESAALSTRLLPPSHAAGLLRGRLDAETDANVREAIGAILEAGTAG